jgi:hypothetical protein
MMLGGESLCAVCNMCNIIQISTNINIKSCRVSRERRGKVKSIVCYRMREC